MRRILKLWLLVTSLLVAQHVMPADGETIAKPPAQTSFDSSRAQLLARIKDRWSDQIEQSTKVRDNQPLDLIGADGTPAVHGGYAVTSPRNPLIDENCRVESLASALTHWGHVHHATDEEAFNSREAHIRDLQKQLAAGPTFSAWIAHIAKCKDFCQISVKDLLLCHIQSVSSRPHTLVYFGLGRDRVDPGPAVDSINSFTEGWRAAPDHRILLIGRSSRLGSAGPVFNRALSQRRTQAVRDALVASGVPQDRIQVQSIGYEEPQLTQSVAEVYGITDEFSRLGESGANQSVVMVLY